MSFLPPPPPASLTHSCLQSGRTALTLACLYGFQEIMRALLEAGADVNSSDEVRDLINTSLDQHGVQWGKTVLMYAASRGDTDCVKMLLEYRADVSLRDLVRLLSPLAPALTSLTLQSNKDARDHARTGRNLQEIIPLLLDVTLPSLSSPSLSLCRLSELKFCQKRQRVLQR
jgi:ankyrin repeat protein